VKYDNVEITYDEKKMDAIKEAQKSAYKLLQENKLQRKENVAALNRGIALMKNGKLSKKEDVDSIQKALGIYGKLDIYQGKILDDAHPLKELVDTYRQAKILFESSEFFVTKETIKIKEESGKDGKKEKKLSAELKSVTEKLAFLSDISGDGKVSNFNRHETKRGGFLWLTKETVDSQLADFSETQLHSIL